MSRPIQLLFLANSPAVMAGVEKTAVLLAKHIDRDAFDIRFVLNGEGPFADALRTLDVNLEIIACGGRYSRAWHGLLKASLAKQPADVVQLHLSRMNARCLQKWGVKVVERLNMTRHSDHFYPMRWRWLDVQTANWIDRFVVVSESLKAQFVERGYDPAKMQVVHNGVPTPTGVDRNKLRQELGIGDVPVVGTAARLTAQKGLDTFLQAAKTVQDAYPDAHIVLAGDGELDAALRQQAAELALTNLHFLGFRHDVLNVIAALDVMVYLSRWEPYANTILEAMSVGTPVVATDVGGNAEAIENQATGLLVPVDDATAAAEAVLSVLRSSQFSTQLQDAAKAVVAERTVERMVRGHEDAYRTLVPESGR